MSRSGCRIPSASTSRLIVDVLVATIVSARQISSSRAMAARFTSTSSNTASTTRSAPASGLEVVAALQPGQGRFGLGGRNLPWATRRWSDSSMRARPACTAAGFGSQGNMHPRRDQGLGDARAHGAHAQHAGPRSAGATPSYSGTLAVSRPAHSTYILFCVARFSMHSRKAVRSRKIRPGTILPRHTSHRLQDLSGRDQLRPDGRHLLSACSKAAPVGTPASWFVVLSPAVSWFET